MAKIGSRIFPEVTLHSQPEPAAQFLVSGIVAAMREIVGDDEITSLFAPSVTTIPCEQFEIVGGGALFYGVTPITLQTRTGLRFRVWAEVYARERSWYYARLTFGIGNAAPEASFFVQLFGERATLQVKKAPIIFPKPVLPKKRRFKTSR